MPNGDRVLAGRSNYGDLDNTKKNFDTAQDDPGRHLSYGKSGMMESSLNVPWVFAGGVLNPASAGTSSDLRFTVVDVAETLVQLAAPDPLPCTGNNRAGCYTPSGDDFSDVLTTQNCSISSNCDAIAGSGEYAYDLSAGSFSGDFIPGIHVSVQCSAAGRCRVVLDKNEKGQTWAVTRTRVTIGSFVGPTYCDTLEDLTSVVDPTENWRSRMSPEGTQAERDAYEGWSILDEYLAAGTNASSPPGPGGTFAEDATGCS